jgi:hypothetical protein
MNRRTFSRASTSCSVQPAGMFDGSGEADGDGLGAVLGAALGAALAAALGAALGPVLGAGAMDGAGGNVHDGAAAVVHAATVAAVAPRPASAETRRKPRRLSAEVVSEGTGSCGSTGGVAGTGSRSSVVLMAAHDTACAGARA